MMLLLNKLTAALNEKKHSIVIFCDLKKAFDTCDHDILLQKMSNIGIRNTELAWFSNYLKDRLQYDANQNVDEVSLLDGKNDFIWFPSGQAPSGYVKVTFKDGGEMTIEKRKLDNVGIYKTYATKNGNWKKTSTGWEFSLEGKNYPSQYNGTFIVNALFSLLKDSGYYSWTDSSFIPFNGKENIKWQDL